MITYDNKLLIPSIIIENRNAVPRFLQRPLSGYAPYRVSKLPLQFIFLLFFEKLSSEQTYTHEDILCPSFLVHN